MSGLENSKILVTGAAGFLGRHIVPSLVNKGAEVFGIDLKDRFETSGLTESRNKVELVEADITDSSQLRKLDRRLDYVIHLAARAVPRQCEEDPTGAFETNVKGTYNVLKHALDNGAKKFIFSSSAHVYGISPKYMPTDERHPLALQDTYTTTKIIGESLCQLFYSNHDLAYTALRLFNCYGPGQSTDYFMPAMIAKAMNGSILLRGKSITKDFVFVEDVVDAFVKASLSDYVGEMNIGSGIQTSLKTVASHIARAFGAELVFEKVKEPGPTHMQCDPARAIRILGWESSTPLVKGLNQTIKFFRENSRGKTRR